MLDLAGQLRKYENIVAPKLVPLSTDVQRPLTARFELRIDDEGRVVVDEQILQEAGTTENTRKLAHSFTEDEMRCGKAQLKKAFLWQACGDQGFDEKPPIFPPLTPKARAREFSVD